MRRSLFAVTVICAAALAAWFITGYRLQHAAVSASTPVKKESAYDRVMRTGVLRCGYVAWAPFFEKDPNTKEIRGISKEMSDIIIQLVGWKVEYHEILPEQKITLLESGKIDAVCGDGPWAIQAAKFLSFTRPNLFAPVIAYVRADESRLHDRADFNNENIIFSATDGDVSVELTQRKFPKAKVHSLSATSNSSQMLLDVVDKKSDVVLTDTITFQMFDRSNPHQLKVGLQQPIAVYGAGFSTLKKDIALYQTINELTESALNLGIIDQALDTYDPDHKLFIRTAKSYEQSQTP